MPLRYLQMSQVDNMLPEHHNFMQDTDNNDSDGEFNMDRIPFAKNTFKMDIKHLSSEKLPFKVINGQDKENMSVAGNKMDQTDNVDNEIIETNNNRPVTPANETGAGPGQPLTPTANLKVLFNAMSPELRNREEQKRDTSDDDAGDSPSNSQEKKHCSFDSEHSYHQYETETIIELTSSQEERDSSFGPSRKDKSLGLLCQKFLQKYPEYPKPYEMHKICLDEVAKELKVERRRIYDIVNVLESVEIVSRIAKNMYAWHGKSNLKTTLAKLKVLGESEGFAEQIQKLKDFEFNRELEQQLGKYAPKTKPSAPDFPKESSLLNQAALRKDKSLGIMSQKFLMLFLVSKPKTVNLDLSAKLLIGDANIDKTENAKFKTKIRRLYDIANILTSLDLIRKVHVTEIRGRKPAFKYIGPDIDDNEEINNMLCCSDGVHRPCSRHSMLDCIQNQEVASILHSYKPIKPATSKAVAQLRAETEDDDGSPTKPKFGRHSSFDQICAVAEQERNKLYASASEPASPTQTIAKEIIVEVNPELKGKTHESKPMVLIQSEDGNFQVLNENGLEDKTGENTNKLPTKGFVRKKSQQKIIISEPQEEERNATAVSSEAFIIKTSGRKPIATARGKQPTVIPLTKDQIDAVLRSLKVPVPLNQESVVEKHTKLPQEYYEEVTEDGITKIQVTDMKEANEKTPVISSESSANLKCSEMDNKIPIEKRVRLDFPSPVSGDDSSPSSISEKVTVMRLKRKGDDVKPSPQRALHLTPGFNAGSPSKRIRIEVTPAGDAAGQITINKTFVQSGFKLAPHFTQSPGSKTVDMQLSNQPSTVFHVPVVNIQSSQQLPQPVTAVSHQILQNNGSHGPNLAVPSTFSPPLTPNSAPASPKLFTFPSTHQPSSSVSLTNVHVVQATSLRVQAGGTVAQLIKPVATKPTMSPNPGSQIMPPQLVTPTTIFPNKAQSGFVPITSSISNMSKIIITQQGEPTARKIGFDDVSALV